MIWLIGNKGMLGTEVEALLRNRQMNFVATDLEVDISDMEQLRRFASGRPISWIVNCAAWTAVDRAEDEPEEAFRVNAQGPQNLAILAGDLDATLIHISTDYVFDGSREEDYVETDSPNPIGVYGRSKLKGETNIAGVHEKYFILRTSWLYGNHGPNFVATMMRLFTEQDEVRIVGDQYGSPTYAPDLAETVLAVLLSGSSVYGIYHFSNEGRISWFDFACAIYSRARERGLLSRDVVLRRIRTGDYPTRATRPRYSCLSNTKIIKEFDIPVRDWQDALAEFFHTDRHSFERTVSRATEGS